MISQTVEYALRAVLFLASQAPKACTTQQIATAAKMPAPYLSKVLQSLVRSGLVASQRGLGGGMTLLKSPAEIAILDVVNAVEPLARIHTCPLGLASHGTTLCPLHRRLDNALAQVEEAFRGSSLADLLAEPSTSIPLCEFPPLNCLEIAAVTQTGQENA